MRAKLLALLALCVVAGVLLFSTRYIVLRVNAQSMLPTYCMGDYVVARALSDNGQLVIEDGISKGAPVVFSHRGELYTKRIAGVAGDVVAYDLVYHDLVWVNEAPYCPQGSCDEAKASQLLERRAIPQGRVFVVGDNTMRSLDSRTFGDVPIEMLVGRVVARVPSFNSQCEQENLK